MRLAHQFHGQKVKGRLEAVGGIPCRPYPAATLFTVASKFINPLEFRGNYSATSNNMQLVRWPLMGGLLHLV